MKKLENLIPHEAYGPFLQSAPLYNKSIAFVYSENTDDRLPYLCDQISIYCPKCKKFVCANKKLDFWSLPKCLIINFKRFVFIQNKY